MENLGKIDSAKDLVTKEWVGAQDFLPSEEFTKNGIKNALGIADWALAASKPSYDDVYLKLAGGTISGALLVNSTLTTSGSIYCHANLKINAGGKLILGNDEGITSWSDLKSKIAYSFSEISSKPTTLSGYGITDALKIGSGFEPTTSGEPSIIGYSGQGEGWPAGGPAMRWGTNGYYARLQVELNTNNPRLLLSGVYNNTAYDWVEILTDKNFSSYGIANMSNDASGSANDILTSSVNGVVERLTDIPIRYGSLLTFAAKDAFYRGQLIINYQSDMAIRCHDGRWSDWAKVVTDKNFASYGVKAGNFNTTGSANDITVPSIVGDFESLQNMPFHYCNVLTITTTPHYYVGQIAIDYTGRMAVRGQDYDGTWSSWRTILDTNNIGTTSLPKINLNGVTITNWDQVKMEAGVLITTTGSQILFPNKHYTFSHTLTSSSNISITLTDDTSGESITKIYYIVFRTGATTPTFTFNRTLYWKDGKTLTSLAANKRYRIVIDDNLATLETYS